MTAADKYAPYYLTYQARASWVMLADAIFAGSNLRRRSILNRQRDYVALAGRPDRFRLHALIHQHLQRAQREWQGLDYGEGYFYQGYQAIGISGLRDTEARMQAMNLVERVSGKRVLEIGCNTGFIAAQISATARAVVGLDINGHLVTIAALVADELRRENCAFTAAPFETFEAAEPFDVVLSFANHSTFDGNTTQPLDQYFERCAAALRPDGELLFESHAPAYEGDRLATALSSLERHFEIRSRTTLNAGTFLDRGRTFVVATRRPTRRNGAGPAGAK